MCLSCLLSASEGMVGGGRESAASSWIVVPKIKATDEAEDCTRLFSRPRIRAPHHDLRDAELIFLHSLHLRFEISISDSDFLTTRHPSIIYNSSPCLHLNPC